MPTATKPRYAVDARELSHALGLLLPLTRTRTAMAITSHVLLTVGAEGVTLQATNLEQAATYQLSASAELDATDARFVIPAARLDAFVSGRAGDITLEPTASGVTVRAGGARLNLPTMSPEDFPWPVDDGWDLVAEVPTGEWARQAGRVVDAVSSDKADKPTHTGVHLLCRGGQLVMEATDSYRVHAVPLMPHGGDIDLNIPREAMALSARLTDEGMPVQLSTRAAGGSVRLECGPAMLITTTILGSFPNLGQAIALPAGQHSARVVRADLMAEIGRIQSILARDVLVRLYVEPEGLRVAAREAKAESDAQATVPATTRGDGRIAVSASYLRDALDAAAGNTVVLSWEGSQAALRVACDPEDGWVGVLMPRFYTWEEEV